MTIACNYHITAYWCPWLVSSVVEHLTCDLTVPNSGPIDTVSSLDYV